MCISKVRVHRAIYKVQQIIKKIDQYSAEFTIQRHAYT